MRARSVSDRPVTLAAAPRMTKDRLEALDQPGAERVEPIEPGKVDVDGAGAGVPTAGVFDQALELGGALDRPGARYGERDMVALGGGGERSGAHRRPPTENAAVSLKP